ncbi:MAG: DNA/RNA non-specific endonuclease, partial [Sphaerochaetaceae bacterium]
MVRKKQKHTGCKALLLSLVVLLALFIGITVASTPHEVSSGSVSWPQGVELPAPVPGEQQVSHCGYALSYNEQYEQPSWVAYQLTCDEVVGTIERTDNFRPDPAILTRSASLDDYRSSGYDRGHLIPAADQKWSAQAMDDSFYLSNMSPQTGAFNRGIWSHLEAVVRTFANDNGAIY